MTPEIRAAMVKDFLALLRDGRVERGPEILAMAEPGFVQSVEDASRLAWLPAGPVVRLADRARELVGPESWRATHREVATELSSRKLFRAFLQGMGAVFGTHPSTYCRVFPVVLQQAHRHYGAIEAVLGEDTDATIRFSGAPAGALSRGMLDVFAGTVEGLVGSVAHGVTVEVGYLSGASDATLTVRWESERRR